MSDFKQLPHWGERSATDRLAGFELELAGLRLSDCVDIIQAQFGGDVEQDYSLEAAIKDTPFGTFQVELDSGWGKRVARRLERVDENDPEEVSALKRQISEWMGEAAAKIVPMEIVTPPLAFHQFDEVEKLRDTLHTRQAQGTRHSFFHAFGMHINPEVPDESVEKTHAIMRAFLLLYPWLKQKQNIDTSRRILSFIDPFPESYVRKLAAQESVVSWEQFIEDYLAENASRNRALDLLPLFAHVRPESLSALDSNTQRQVKARPAYHYRLPNCDIDQPNWRIANEWNAWVAVEELAVDTPRLNEWAEILLRFLDKPLHWFSQEWIAFIDTRLKIPG